MESILEISSFLIDMIELVLMCFFFKFFFSEKEATVDRELSDQPNQPPIEDGQNTSIALGLKPGDKVTAVRIEGTQMDELEVYEVLGVYNCCVSYLDIGHTYAKEGVLDPFTMERTTFESSVGICLGCQNVRESKEILYWEKRFDKYPEDGYRKHLEDQIKDIS